MIRLRSSGETQNGPAKNDRPGKVPGLSPKEYTESKGVTTDARCATAMMPQALLVADFLLLKSDGSISGFAKNGDANVLISPKPHNTRHYQFEYHNAERVLRACQLILDETVFLSAADTC